MIPAHFIAWFDSPLRGLALDTQIAGRLQAKAKPTIADLANAADVRQQDADFELLGPGDVVRLAAGAISRRYPMPGAADAEETKTALVEFSRADLLDLPWRYSPEKARSIPAQGTGVRPWLVLVVGTADELALTRDGAAVLGPAVQAAHALSGSWRWAHQHEIHGTTLARILCPRDLAPYQRYTACLVPAFVIGQDGTLSDAWPRPGGGEVRLPCYDHWSFRTGPEGDFAQLATLLQAVDSNALGDGFGTAKIRYDRRDAGSPPRASLDTAGALQRPVPPAAAPPDAWVATEVAALTDPLVTSDGRWVLTAPRYHAPFVAPFTTSSVGWIGNLGADPRHRASAGLGAWAAIAWQDRIATAAWTKAGELSTAQDRVNAVAFGLEASRAMWRRRMPSDPVEALAVLAPVLARLPATGGGTVLDVVAGRTPLFARALWSSAARRALRAGPARSQWAQPGAGRFANVLRLAAQCPPHRPEGATVLGGRDVAPGPRRGAMKDAIFAAGVRDAALAQEVADRLVGGATLPSPALLAAVLALLDPGGRAKPDRDAIFRLMDHGNVPPFDPRELDEALATLDRLRQRTPPCRPVDLDALGRRVAAAVDPTAARPVVIDRVLGTLPGLKDIGPIEIEPELDLPLWSFLSTTTPNWLLPGVDDLPTHRVVAMSTNPSFVEALLVGANHQTLGELRWRNLPIASAWSPLRKFWQRRGGAFDIEPIRGWPAASPLGGAGLQFAGTGMEAVIVFRTPLFRRYPATVVYLYRDKGSPKWAKPDDHEALVEGDKVAPTFTGTIGPDVTFFGFPVLPSELLDHWVVLEEPVTGYRFYTENKGGGVIGQVGANAAEYAKKTFAVPLRVMIGALMQSL